MALFPASAVGGPCLTRLRSAESSTAVVTLAVLLSGLGSPVADVTLAVLVNPVATRDGSTATMSFTVTLPPLATEPRAQLTVVPMMHVPADVVADFGVTPTGSGSLRVTFCAVDGPALATTSV